MVSGHLVYFVKWASQNAHQEPQPLQMLCPMWAHSTCHLTAAQNIGQILSLGVGAVYKRIQQASPTSAPTPRAQFYERTPTKDLLFFSNKILWTRFYSVDFTKNGLFYWVQRNTISPFPLPPPACNKWLVPNCGKLKNPSSAGMTFYPAISTSYNDTIHQ